MAEKNASKTKQTLYGVGGGIAGANAGALASVGPKAYKSSWSDEAVAREKQARRGATGGFKNRWAAGTNARYSGKGKAATIGITAGYGAGVVGGVAAARRNNVKKSYDGLSDFGVEPGEICKLTDKEKKGLAVGAVGGLAGPPGSALASGYLAPKGKKGRYAAGGAAGGFLGPIGGATTGYLAASAPTKTKKRVKKSYSNISAFGVEH